MNSTMELQPLIDALKSKVQKNDVEIFQKKLFNIQKQFQDTAPVVSIIKMLQSIGKYLVSHQEHAHKDAVLVLDLIFTQLTKVIQAPDIKKKEMDEILSDCAQHFNGLKKTIAAGPKVSNKEMQDLKSVIFAIDWEISDATLKGLSVVVTRLMVKFKSHKIHYTFLKIINNVGQYIASKKADAHVDSIPFLCAVFEHFEKVVQTPEMPLNEKKELLKRDLITFQKFNKGPASPAKKSSMAGDGSEDDSVQPALSHVASSPTQESHNIPELSVLSDNKPQLADKSKATEVITPALVGGKKAISEPRDVMDDLFTVKKTSADELLDAIHLRKNENAMAELSDDAPEDEGIKKIIPQRMDNEPIPEIGNRLDTFFNLDSSGDEDGDEDGVVLSQEEKGLDPPDSDEGIVPFQYEDEITEDFSKYDPSQEILERLKNTLNDPGNYQDHDTLQKVKEDIAHLGTLWKSDPDKILLLETISCLVQFIHKPADTEPAVQKSTTQEPAVQEPTAQEPAVQEPTTQEPAVQEPPTQEPAVQESTAREPAVKEATAQETTVQETTDSELPDFDEMAPETSPSEDPPKGLWQRIKSVFSN